MTKEKDIKQLFYDLYNNVKNEKADDREFEILYKTNYNIAKIHYDILTISMSDLNNEMWLKLANNMQDFIAVWLFK